MPGTLRFLPGGPQDQPWTLWRAAVALVVALLLVPVAIAVADPLPVEESSSDPDRQPPIWNEAGAPFFFEHFTPQEYQHFPQNWAVTQDHRGVIYAANQEGVLEFDGSSWRRVSSLTSTAVVSLAVAADSTIFVGGNGDLGYLAPDSLSTLAYVSLSEHIPERHLNFDEIWKTHAVDDATYFQGRHRLFRWDGREMDVLTTETIFHTSFSVDGRVLVNEQGVGLQEVRNGQLELLPEGAQFASTGIHMIDAVEGTDELMIATRQGLYLHDGTDVEALSSSVDSFLRESRLYHGTQIDGGLYALATLGGGVGLIDREGNLLYQLHEGNGLPDNWINFVFQDQQGGLWLALNNRGLVRVDLPAQVTAFTADDGLRGTINRVLRFAGQLYVGTSTGLYVLDRSSSASLDAPLMFERVDEVPSVAVWSLMATENLLWIATDNGLFSLRESSNAVEVVEQLRGNVYALKHSDAREGIVYVGYRDGLAIFRETSDEVWTLDRSIAATTGSIRTVRETDASSVWVERDGGQIERLLLTGFAEDDIRIRESRPFGESDGLPHEGAVLMELRGTLYALSMAEGFYKYDKDIERFTRDPSLTDGRKAVSDTVFALVEGPSNDAWLAYSDGTVEHLLPEGNDGYTRNAPYALRFGKSTPINLYAEESGILWIGSGDELLRYDPHVQKRYERSFPTLVRRVGTGNGQRVYFGGARTLEEMSTIPYSDTGIRFEFAAPTFNQPEKTVFRYRLAGLEDEWSAWTDRSALHLSNLWEGEYTLHVEARNAQGVVGEAAAFSFEMLPPWYRTWWAFALYAGGVGILLLLGYNYRQAVQERKRAERQARELARERVVNERLQQANRRLQQANEGLKQANKLKDEFLANTSHELRTPLTAILGFTSVLQEETDDHHSEFLELIEMNGQRLLNTVNSLLDIAKLRAGMVDMERAPVAMRAVSERIARMLQPLAEQKGLEMRVLPDADDAEAFVDRRYLEQILFNLVGNAIKFTPEGRVEVDVVAQAHTVILQVSDTGVGIDEAFLPHLFEEFKQESSGLNRSHEGSGLGLSITARLVNMMEGTIEVESEKGEGTTFTVAFPQAEESVHTPPTDAQAKASHDSAAEPPSQQANTPAILDSDSTR